MIAWQLFGNPTSSPSGSERGSQVPSSQHAIDGDSNWSEEIATPHGSIRLLWSSWNSGKALGMKCLTVETPNLRTILLPSRGMGIWKSYVRDADAGWVEFGWNSPVQGPVHPSLVPVGDPSGIGWLEGFDELLVRCGLLSNGAPDFEPSGNVLYPVHGRIANLPADSLRIEYRPEDGFLDVIGTVTESRFLIYTLQLESRIRFRIHPTSDNTTGIHPNTIEIQDTVTNLRSTPGSMQLLYHINLGQPVLQAGSKIVAPLHRLAPRDPRAAEGVTHWDRCNGPESGYAEQVYYCDPICDAEDWTQAMLCNGDESLGFTVHFDKSTLPVVNFWKNTQSVEDGYVMGIEPATGFPNTKTFEQRNGRVVPLQGGQSRTFRLRLEPHLNAASVAASKQRIEKLQNKPCCIESQPVLGWSPAADDLAGGTNA